MSWDAIVRKVTPYVVKIETQDGWGTGFLCLYNEDQSWGGIATALHVVAQADRWQQPIRITHHSSGKTLLLKEGERVILPGLNGADSAVLLFSGPLQLDLPKQLIDLFPTQSTLAIGSELGWLGFPAIASGELCFFSGKVSASLNSSHAYLIDGVAINGVSGGPVFYHTGSETQIVGAITAYRANKTTGDSLPGLAIAEDVTHLHDVDALVKARDEENRQNTLKAPKSGSTLLTE